MENRIGDGRKIWKLSPMDLESYERWYDYTRARDAMLEATDSGWAPWHVVKSDDKKRARLNVINHLLSLVPYKKLPRDKVELPKRQSPKGYIEPAYEFKYIPEIF
jgi:polyphosphate kinase 2 (PPK2 family)